MSFTKLGVVLPLGASGDFDDVHIYTPGAVVRDGKTWLYYVGYDGATYRVGLAVSNNGIHFTKLGVVIPLGASGDFDCVYDEHLSAVIRGGKTWLYYLGHDGANKRIGLAVSDDGIHFTKLGVVIPLGASGDFDDYDIRYLSAMVREGKTWLYYAAHDGTTIRIGLAVSDDGIHFTKLGVVIPRGASGDFDDGALRQSQAVIRGGKTWLYYTGFDGVNDRIGLAVSDDGIHFIKLGVVIPRGASGTFDDWHTRYPSLIVREGKTWLYYAAHDGIKSRVGLAVSDMGL